MSRAEDLVNGVLVAFGVLAIALMGTHMAWDGLVRRRPRVDLPP